MKLFDFEQEKEKEFKAMGFKSLRKVEKIADHQLGKSNLRRDIVRDALKPGKRISRTGNTYYEYRKNRSDLKGKL